jgi:hypothetical protein
MEVREAAAISAMLPTVTRVLGPINAQFATLDTLSVTPNVLPVFSPTAPIARLQLSALAATQDFS